MRKTLFLIFLYLALFLIKSQNSKLIYNYNLVKNSAMVEEAKADSLYNLVFRNISSEKSNYDSLCRDMIIYGNTLNNKDIIAFSTLLTAQIARKKENYAEAVTGFLNALSLLDSVKHIKKVCFAHQSLAYLYKRTNNFELSRVATLKALTIAEYIQDSNLLFESYNFIGSNYIREKKFDEAKKIYRKAISIAIRKNNKLFLTKVYTNLGIAYRNLQQWDSALYYHKLSYNIAKEINNRYNISFALNDIGVIYLRIDEYNKALDYLFESAKMREADGEKWELGFTYNFIAECYVNMGDLKKSEEYARKGLSISYKSNNIRQRYESYEYLYVLKSLRNQFDSAYLYLLKHSAIKDSFQRVSNKFMTEALIASYQTKEKEKSILLLSEVTKNQNLEIQRQRLFIVLSIIGLVLMIGIIGLIFRNRKQSIRKQKLEAQLKEESIKRLESEKMQKEKERISRDLHDHVGGQLSYILYSLDDLNAETLKRNSDLKENINLSIRSVIQSLRETIWAINDDSLSINDFSDKIKVYARGMFKHTKVKLSFKENVNGNIEFPSLVGLNLYRICQEVLNNAFKYSNASELSVEVSSNQKTKIVIRDNGNGFDTEKVSSGFGLNNIYKRVKEIDAEVLIESSIGNGVVVTIVV